MFKALSPEEKQQWLHAVREVDLTEIAKSPNKSQNKNKPLREEGQSKLAKMFYLKCQIFHKKIIKHTKKQEQF